MSNRIHLNTSLNNTHHIEVGYHLNGSIVKYFKDTFTLNKAVFIVDENVHRLYNSTFIEEITSIFDETIYTVVPEGEQSKSLNQYSILVDEILTSTVERNTPVIVIGGGVTGDLGGFVAASCLRGMPLIHIPTSLLAMVDSSIGGKTGINHSVGKNLLGAFYHPKMVFVDLKFLESLPHVELINGLGEVIKYGMIRDAQILEQLKQLPLEQQFSYSVEWEQLVKNCASIKVDVVSQDFKESGLREILNFGHTFAHVIEKVGNYKACSHGEAVYMGMWGAVKMSNLLGYNIEIANLSAFRSLYTSSFKTELSVKELTNLMKSDKKVTDGAIKVILLEELEQAISKKILDTSLIEESWKYIIKEFAH